MGRRSCSLRPESARGRVMMAPPVDVAGLRPRLGDVEAPPKPRSSLSSVAEVESEPLGRARRRPSAEARAESEPWGLGRRSCSLRPESARGRVMMAPPVDVADLRPRLGDVEAPPKPRSSLSSVAGVESEPPGRARRRPSAEARAESEPWGRAERCSSSSGA